MAQRPSRLLGLPETRSLIFLIKNSPDQVEGYLDYLQPREEMPSLGQELRTRVQTLKQNLKDREKIFMAKLDGLEENITAMARRMIGEMENRMMEILEKSYMKAEQPAIAKRKFS
jgi:hypothetical protein